MQWSKSLRSAARVLPEGCSAIASAGRMRAWRVHAYGALTDLRLEEARVPPLRAPDDLLVRVTAASINPIDIAMIGGYGARALNVLRAFDGIDDVEFPLVPGRDFVGIVERAGPDARLRPGQRVWGVVPPHRQGSHAEYVVVKDEWAGPAPTTLEDSAAGGALYAALTACAALRVAGLGSRRTGNRPNVLLLGLGGVGQAALQLLVHRQAEVTVGCSGELTQLAFQLGAAQAFDRHLEDYHRKLEESGPYEVVLDCAGLGGDEASSRAWRFSRYVTLTTPLLRSMDARGVAPGAICAAGYLALQSAKAAFQRLPASNSTMTLGTVLPPHVRWAFFTPNAADIELLRRLAEKRKFDVRVEDVYSMSTAQQAYERAAKGRARGKLMLDFSSSDTNIINRCQ